MMCTAMPSFGYHARTHIHIHTHTHTHTHTHAYTHTDEVLGGTARLRERMRQCTGLRINNKRGGAPNILRLWWGREGRGAHDWIAQIEHARRGESKELHRCRPVCLLSSSLWHHGSREGIRPMRLSSTLILGTPRNRSAAPHCESPSLALLLHSPPSTPFWPALLSTLNPPLPYALAGRYNQWLSPHAALTCLCPVLVKLTSPTSHNLP
jgi:hypothetical protein